MEKIITSTLMLLAVEYGGVLLAVIADLVSGIRKSYRKGERCTSRGLRRSVDKLSSYFIAMFSLSVVDGMFMAACITLASGSNDMTVPAFPYLTTIGALSLAIIEIKSIMETSANKEDLHKAADLLGDILRYLRHR